MAHKWAAWLHNPCLLEGSRPLQSGGAESQVAHKWARWIHNPPPPLGGSPPLHNGRQKQRWLTSGPSGYITPAAYGVPHRFKAGGKNNKGRTSGPGGYITPPPPWGVPTAAQRGAEAEVAQKWARWLHNPYPAGGPHRFTAGGIVRGGSHVGQVGT